MEILGKVCSRCSEFKSLSEFYKQGNRHESLRRTCKKSSRKKRDEVFETSHAEEIDATFETQESNSVHPKSAKRDDREVMPIYDESIFYPAERRRAVGISDDDMDSIVAFFRWHIEQREKRLKKKMEE